MSGQLFAKAALQAALQVLSLGSAELAEAGQKLAGAGRSWPPLRTRRAGTVRLEGGQLGLLDARRVEQRKRRRKLPFTFAAPVRPMRNFAMSPNAWRRWTVAAPPLAALGRRLRS